MKVNMALISGEESTPIAAPMDEQMPAVETDAPEEDSEDDELDESDKHSKVKTFLLIAAMIGGFGLFVWNMTGLVNNMRLDDQGYAVNIVSEMEDVDSFMDDADDEDSSGDQTESEVSTDAARDGPDSGGPAVDIDSFMDNDANGGSTGTSGSSADVSGTAQYADESEEMAALRREAELVKRELAIAEDMLDSSLQREADLKAELESLGGSRE